MVLNEVVGVPHVTVRFPSPRLTIILSVIHRLLSGRANVVSSFSTSSSDKARESRKTSL